MAKVSVGLLLGAAACLKGVSLCENQICVDSFKAVEFVSDTAPEEPAVLVPSEGSNVTPLPGL